MSRQLESIFKDVARADLKMLDNIWFFKSNEVAVHGILDFIICLNGYFISIELKKDEDSDPDPLQLYTLHRIQKKGKGVSIVAHPKNWASVLSYLRSIDRGPPAGINQYEPLEPHCTRPSWLDKR